MAPFYVSRETELYRDHPDWWVRKPGSEDEISFNNLGTGDYAVIDPTHPEAAEWLSALIASKVAEGWTYLKLDFLYAGAEVGERHADVTAIEAFHVGMEIIREAAGDAWILAVVRPSFRHWATPSPSEQAPTLPSASTAIRSWPTSAGRRVRRRLGHGATDAGGGLIQTRSSSAPPSRMQRRRVRWSPMRSPVAPDARR